MKQLLTLCILFLLLLMAGTPLYAQTRGISYQAVARDATGTLIANQTVNVGFLIREGNASGPVIYNETHGPVTNDFALFSVVIGDGAVVSGDFSTIDWAANAYFLEVQINGASVGVTELLAVPYSKVATDMGLEHLRNVETSGVGSGSVLKFDGANWVAGTDDTDDADINPTNEIQTLSLSGSNLALSSGGGSVVLDSLSPWNENGTDIYYDNGFVGIGTDNPSSGLHLSSTSNFHDIRIDDSFPFLLLNTVTGSGNMGIKFENQSAHSGWIAHMASQDAIYISGRNSPTAFPNIAVASNGRVGIGTGTPSFPLHLAEDTMSINGLEIANLGSSNLGLDGDVVPYGGSALAYDLGNNTSTEHWDDVVATAFVTFSDARLKEEVADLPVGLPELMALRPVQYRYQSRIDVDGALRYGLIAQEVESVLPNVVINEDVDVNPETGQVERAPTPYKAMNYQELLPVLIKSIQEQQAYIETLEQRIQQLEQTRNE